MVDMLVARIRILTRGYSDLLLDNTKPPVKLQPATIILPLSHCAPEELGLNYRQDRARIRILTRGFSVAPGQHKASSEYPTSSIILPLSHCAPEELGLKL